MSPPPAGLPAGGWLPNCVVFLDAAAIPGFECDLATGQLRLSAAAAAVLGVGEARALDLATHDQAVHPDDLERLRAERLGAVEQGGPFRLDYRLRRTRDGRPVRLEARGTALPGEGDTAGVVLAGTLQDVTLAGRDEGEVAALCRALSTEVAALTRLHRLAGRLMACGRLQSFLEEVLAATMGLQGADCGALRLYEPERRTLRLAAQRGFDQAPAGGVVELPVTGRMLVAIRAFNTRRRIVVEDIARDADPLLDRVRAAQHGIRAVQAIPLVDRQGRALGVVTAYFRTPVHPSASELHHLDVFIAQAADAIAARLDDT